MNAFHFFVLFLFSIISIALSDDVGRTKSCNNYNNDCRSCVQAYSEDRRVKVHNCNFCFVDGMYNFLYCYLHSQDMI